MSIPPRARIRARAGKASLLVTAVERPRRHVVPLVAALESRVMAYFAGSLAAHLGIWALLQIIPLEGGAANADLGMQETVSMRSSSTEKETPPPEVKDGDSTAGTEGGDTSAPGPEGSSGNSMALAEARHIEIKHRADEDAHLTKEEAREMAAQSGILGSAPMLMQGVTSIAATEDFANGFSDIDIPGSIMDGASEGGPGFGIGRRGFGAGGGCSIGPCGIGAGQYHTLGIGSHAGRGYDGFGHGPGTGGHHPEAPQPRVGEARLTGDYDKSIIRRYIKRNIDKIAYCYERQLLAHPGLEGEVLVQFFIQPNGTVRGSNGKGFDASVASCVAAVVGQIEFPAPNGGGVEVNYPFNFHPATGR
jgi:hypothetical protein